ncbi:hypothetical protein DL770_006790 [Monosporascus sp. CRB-9-2]|nr:hypothetical protein DL770_006790 [Monosporascus sp. CRB-9-2]
MATRASRANGQPCGTEIANAKGSISSHRKIHDSNSAYNREAVKFQQPLLCQEIMEDGTLCGTPLTSNTICCVTTEPEWPQGPEADRLRQLRHLDTDT